MSEMGELLRGIAEKQAEVVASDVGPYSGCGEALERVLRESGLLRLLEAGQAFCCGGGCWESKKQWDAALAELKEKLHV